MEPRLPRLGVTMGVRMGIVHPSAQPLGDAVGGRRRLLGRSLVAWCSMALLELLVDPTEFLRQHVGHGIGRAGLVENLHGPQVGEPPVYVQHRLLHLPALQEGDTDRVQSLAQRQDLREQLGVYVEVLEGRTDVPPQGGEDVAAVVHRAFLLLPCGQILQAFSLGPQVAQKFPDGLAKGGVAVRAYFEHDGPQAPEVEERRPDVAEAHALLQVYGIHELADQLQLPRALSFFVRWRGRGQ
mmetsp:Transcript_47715/g.139061  ORF Transcript_47715/g.139061 Transcript_47715/m.139061 type:complete len:240 (-) Transcript_47715:199-918(-)